MDGQPPGIEAVIKDERRNADATEYIDFQSLGPHLQILGCPQSIVLAIARGRGLASPQVLKACQKPAFELVSRIEPEHGDDSFFGLDPAP